MDFTATDNYFVVKSGNFTFSSETPSCLVNQNGYGLKGIDKNILLGIKTLT